MPVSTVSCYESKRTCYEHTKQLSWPIDESEENQNVCRYGQYSPHNRTGYIPPYYTKPLSVSNNKNTAVCYVASSGRLSDYDRFKLHHHSLHSNDVTGDSSSSSSNSDLYSKDAASNLFRDSVYSHRDFLWFPRSLKPNTEIVPRTGPPPIPSTSFPIRYSTASYHSTLRIISVVT
jgi:hypothetical protein